MVNSNSCGATFACTVDDITVTSAECDNCHDESNGWVFNAAKEPDVSFMHFDYQS